MTVPTISQPLLRAPPFPDMGVAVAGGPATAPSGLGRDDIDALFALIRTHRVGGCFWDDNAHLADAATIIIKPRSADEACALHDALSPAERRGALWIGEAPEIERAVQRLADDSAGTWRGSVDPWSVIAPAAIPAPALVTAHGDDEWIALARIARLPVRVLSSGRFGAPGLSGEACDAAIAGQLLQYRWRDPFDGAPATIAETVTLLAEWRRILEGNRGIVAATGMAWWKRAEIRRFLWSPGQRLAMVQSPSKAVRIARKDGGAVAIWPSRVSPALQRSAAAAGVALVRVEDGFVRSVGLGSNLVPPSSIVVDRQGIHFDPSQPSDLETILARTDFAPDMIARAANLRETIVSAGISKYAAGADAAALPPRTPGKRVVLVPGQVEDDMSVLAGGGGLASNLELLRRVRALEPDAEIWWRPHPDVDAGHRVGAVPDADAMDHADRIVRGGSMATLLGAVDAVHVLTSLTGFEALMRGREVVCHGTPFYAGWGLTRDLGAVPDRRGRALSLDSLVAGVLILYPRYLDPVSGLPCPPEVLVRRMAQGIAPNRQGWIAPIRRWQGRLMAQIRGHALLRVRRGS